jgi:hypothetical protein
MREDCEPATLGARTLRGADAADAASQRPLRATPANDAALLGGRAAAAGVAAGCEAAADSLMARARGEEKRAKIAREATSFNEAAAPSA